MPNNLTDAEIKKVFECCYTDKGGCDECPYYSRKEDRCIQDGDLFDLPNKIFDLINRQEQENESLKAEVERLRGEIIEQHLAIGELVKQTKAEAYKECIEQLKEKTKGLIGQNFLDDFLNELVGGSDGEN